MGKVENNECLVLETIKELPIYFQLRQHIFSARYHQQTIILDIDRNEYISLGEKAGRYLSILLNMPFRAINHVYEPLLYNRIDCLYFSVDNINRSDLNLFIQIFMKKSFIEICSHEIRKNHSETASLSVGLSEIEWVPKKREINPKISLFKLIETFIVLHKIHVCLKKEKLKGLLHLLKNKTKNFSKGFKKTDMGKIDEISHILDTVCVFYPSKTSCLPWAGALAHLLVRQQYCCDLVLGVQTAPFYAHAWVEVDGKIINDKPEIQERLAPIYKLSLNTNY